ncbi:MAG: SdpI family protein [Planctomycetia bacterium]|jgi:uncharacterized membrane protein|nr:SdpI family protein [Planctomycetia bacterium]
MVALIVVFAFAAVVVCALAVPLMLRKVKPNALYGLRCPATFADEWVWYEANARSGRELFALGFCELILALAPMIDPTLPLPMYVVGNATFLSFGAIFFAIVGWMRANRLLRERRAESLFAGTKPGPG